MFMDQQRIWEQIPGILSVFYLGESQVGDAGNGTLKYLPFQQSLQPLNSEKYNTLKMRN
jgi:hypothetical protein